ncbi:porin [Microvirga flavescens]|uniref:porin n=1 Tax=Microvirga flavescens TaxID=2249811 RepID=UPI000DDAD044|nr:porin [Microvirga flavescens]
MKLVKSLLLGSAAGLAAVAGANAADLPAKKAAPVEYVRVCSTYGAGFFYIPGTETCLRVSGRVRADYVYGQPFDRSFDSNGFRTRGRIQLDARTSTAYGLLRSVVRFEITRNSGTPLTGTGSITQSPNVAEAFIQFGGLTAGRVTSFFDNGDLPTGHMGTLRFSDAPDVGLLAYTFTFGNGFSATLSLEDGLERRNGAVATAFSYAGQRAPDVVGNIKYTGTWGTAQLSAAGHQIRSDNLFTANGFSDFPDTEYGFAVTGQVGVNLPMLAPGDAAWIAATYAHGALGYITGGASNSFGVGTLTAPTIDAFFNPATGNTSLSTGWSVAGGLRHYWTPQIRQNVFGSYASFNYSAAANQAGIPDFNEWRVGTNVFWQPVSGFDIGVEVLYARLDPRGRVLLPVGSNESSWEGRLRVQRDF